MELHDKKRMIASQRITLIGAVCNVILGAVKIIAGFLGHSHALVADGFHSLADLVTDVLVYFAAKYSGHGADRDHPYGHGRIETMATAVISILLILTGLGIMYDAALHVTGPTTIIPAFAILAVALLSILVKEFLFRYTRQVADQYQSEMLRANAWHHRSDALSSVVVLIGMIGVMMGFYFLDALAAIVVGFMVMHMGWDLGWQSVRELVDTAVNEDTLKRIREAILAVDGVKAAHQLRTRLMRGNVLVDVHVMVDPYLSVSEGHHISEQVYVALNEINDDVTDVTVHIDPEDDEIAKPSVHLPTREALLPRVKEAWADIEAAQTIKKWVIHYLDGEIQLEVHLPFDEALTRARITELQSELKAALNEPDVSQITLLFI